MKRRGSFLKGAIRKREPAGIEDMGKKEQRVRTDGGEALNADNPFAGLSGEGLREQAPETAPVSSGAEAEKPKKRKEALTLRRLKAGKGGKVVSEVSGFQAAPQEIESLLKRLQGRLGTGGTRKGAVIELQGECRDRLRPILEDLGYRVKG